MLEGALSVLGTGSNVYVPLAPPPTYSVTFATTCARILRQTISPAQISTRCSFGTTFTAHHSAYVHNTVTGRVGPTNFSQHSHPHVSALASSRRACIQGSLTRISSIFPNERDPGHVLLSIAERVRECDGPRSQRPSPPGRNGFPQGKK